MAIQLQTQDLIHLLNKIALSVSNDLPYSEILSNTLEIVSQELDVQSSVMFAYNEIDKKFWLVAFYGMDSEQALEVEKRRARGLGSGGGTSYEVYRKDKSYYIPDMSQDPRFSDYGNRYPELNRRSFANIPCKSSTKMPLTIALVTKINQQFSEEDIPILEAVAYQIGLLVEKYLLVKDAQNCEWQATTLNEISRQITASLDITQILDALADGVQRLIGADVGFVGLPDSTKAHLIIRSVSKKHRHGLANRTIPILLQDNPQTDPINIIQEKGNSITNAGDQSWADFSSIIQQGYTHIIGYPILRTNRPIGLVCAANLSAHRFRDGDFQLLARLCQQVSTAVENAYLHQQMKTLAVLKERNRLAAEFHDSLAQSISASKMLSVQALTFMDQEKNDKARKITADLVEILESTYIDIREGIFNLTSSLNWEASFLNTLRDFVHAYQTHYGIQTIMDIDEDAIREISGYRAVQIDRIIKEALSNSRKHSHATRVEIAIKQIDASLLITITDNGIGFSLDDPKIKHFTKRGIHIMEERAKGIFAELNIRSSPGQGTQVHLVIPIEEPAEEVPL